MGAESIERPEDVLVEIEVPAHVAEGDLLSVSLPDGCCKTVKVPKALLRSYYKCLLCICKYSMCRVTFHDIHFLPQGGIECSSRKTCASRVVGL